MTRYAHAQGDPIGVFHPSTPNPPDVKAEPDERLGLDRHRIVARTEAKLATFDTWQTKIDNNDHGIDAATNGMTNELRDALLLWRRNRDAPVPDREGAIDHLVIEVDRWRNSGRVFG